jgi:predicted esterase YcpF (UPF0227 family)
MQHLVYLHGFLSSPDSIKAQQTVEFAKKHYPYLNVHVPTLPGNINRAVGVIDSLVSTLPIDRTCFIGSSMGGFLSTYCIEKYAAKNAKKNVARSKAVLINPAVKPYELLSDYMGRHVNPYTQEVFYVHKQHIDKLIALYAPVLNNAKQYKVLLQSGDETLDYRLAAQKYEDALLTIEQGGDHSFVGFEQHLPDIFAFLVNN